jgi:hypothetical protein
MNAYVFALTEYNSMLIAGGGFITAGGNVSANWARWGPSCAVGDLNCDDQVDLADLSLLVDALIDPTVFAGCDIALADLNNDAFVNAADIRPFVCLILSP